MQNLLPLHFAMHWISTTLKLLSPGWVGAIISLVGLIAAVVTYLLTRQRTRLAYCCAGKRLLGLATDALPEGITVHYRGQDIPRLTRTLIVLWNAGEKTILDDDIVEADPLRLTLHGDGRVLAATVLKTKRAVCQIKALPDAPSSSCHNETHIRFAFLDAGDGAVIEILHTNEARYVEVLGTVRGLPQGLHNFSIIQPSDLDSLSVVGMTVAIIGAIVATITIPELSRLYNSIAGQLFIIICAISILSLIAGMCRSRRRYPKCLHIEELR